MTGCLHKGVARIDHLPIAQPCGRPIANGLSLVLQALQQTGNVLFFSGFEGTGLDLTVSPTHKRPATSLIDPGMDVAFKLRFGLA